MTVPQELKNMSCEEFQAMLPELIGSGVDINQHPHIQDCDLCRALLADLEAIADAARQLFPTVEPPDDLWSEIEHKIKKSEQAPEPESDASPHKMAAAPGDDEPLDS